MSLDPLDARMRMTLAQILIYARRYSEAQVVLQDARAIAPGSHRIEEVVTKLLLASGQFEKARSVCESQSTPLDDGDRHFCLALAYHALARQADAERQLEQFKATGGDAAAYRYAEIYAQWQQRCIR